MTDRIASSQSSPSTDFYLEADILSATSTGHWVRMYLRARNGLGGTTGSQYNGAGTQTGWIIGHGTSIVRSANPFLPSGYAAGQQRWRVGPHDVFIAHTAASTANLRMRLDYGSIDVTLSGTIALPAVSGVPGKPAAAKVTGVTDDAIAFTIYSPSSNGGSAITTYNLQIAEDSAFTNIVDSWNSGASSQNRAGKDPATKHWIRYRAVNANGAGAWSDASTATTLPDQGPGVSVAPDISGLSATVTLTPAGGISGVDEYDIEYRPVGGATLTASTTTTTAVITGLTPGVVYEYRATMTVSGWTSPWSSWVTQAQPNPNTNPGSYFDGNTADTTDAVYAWTGTDNNSTTVVTGPNVTEWMYFVDGDDVSGGTGAMQRVTGGYRGSYSARYTFFSDAAAAGFVSGVTWNGGAEVSVGGEYFGSVYVLLPGRSQRMQAGLRLYDAAHNVVSTVWGDEVVVGPSTDWQRLIVGPVTIPPTVVAASPVVHDVAGTGWALWQGGDSYRMDAAMVTLAALFPYFDGSTTDTQEFRYDWDGTPDQSRSMRRIAWNTRVNPLADPDCPPLPEPPLPDDIPFECIDPVGVWRRYFVQVPASEVALWSATVPTLTLSTGSTPERQVRIRAYPNPDGVSPDLLDTDTWESEQILTYIPKATTILIDGVAQRVWAEVNGAAPIPADELLFGTDGVPATWPVLRCGIGYVFTLDVPLDAPPGNLSTQLSLTQRM